MAIDAAVTGAAAAVCLALLGFARWFLQKEVKDNQEAHKRLVDKLEKVDDKIHLVAESVARMQGDHLLLRRFIEEAREGKRNEAQRGSVPEDS